MCMYRYVSYTTFVLSRIHNREFLRWSRYATPDADAAADAAAAAAPAHHFKSHAN